jgi:Tat protein secretion system quality control protein TatD with DNase activity
MFAIRKTLSCPYLKSFQFEIQAQTNRMVPIHTIAATADMARILRRTPQSALLLADRE